MISFFVAYGNDPKYSNLFVGVGGFFFDVDERKHYSGVAYLHFFYNLGLCSMATTIPSMYSFIGILCKNIPFPNFWCCKIILALIFSLLPSFVPYCLHIFVKVALSL